ncbi:MAG: nucleoside triphosphate pyrophosphohydrolase [Bacteroidales bacterium]
MIPTINPQLFQKALSSSEAFDRLVKIMDLLRDFCPWDRKQSFDSLRYLTIEETYELSDAILENDLMEIKKELGDVLLHVVFYAKIGEEKNSFSITDVCNGICEKLIRRHPHIFAEVKVQNEEEVKNNWESIKLLEKESDNEPKSVLGGVPKTLPAMVKAYRIQEKVRGVGFDWENSEQVWDKVQEEIQEFKDELNAITDTHNNKDKLESEFGDILFALINYARFKNINPEDALERTNKKFIQRFKYLESQTLAKGISLHDLNLEQMNVYWEEAKQIENKKI